MKTSTELFHLLSKLLTDQPSQETPSRILYEEMFSLVEDEFRKELGHVNYPKKSQLMASLYEVLDKVEMLAFFPELTGKTVVGIMGTEGPVHEDLLNQLLVKKEENIFHGGKSLPMVLHGNVTKGIEGINLLDTTMAMTLEDFNATQGEFQKKNIDIRSFLQAFSMPILSPYDQTVFLYFPFCIHPSKPMDHHLRTFCDVWFVAMDDKEQWKSAMETLLGGKVLGTVYLVGKAMEESVQRFFKSYAKGKTHEEEDLLYVKEKGYGKVIVRFLKDQEVKTQLQEKNGVRHNLFVPEDFLGPLTKVKSYLVAKIKDQEELLRKMNENLLKLEDEDMGTTIRTKRLEAQDFIVKTRESYQKISQISEKILEKAGEYEASLYDEMAIAIRTVENPNTPYHEGQEEKLARLTLALIITGDFKGARIYGERLKQRGWPYGYLFDLYMDQMMRRSLHANDLKTLGREESDHSLVNHAKIRFGRELNLEKADLIRLAKGLQDIETGYEAYLMGESFVAKSTVRAKIYYEEALRRGYLQAGYRLIKYIRPGEYGEMNVLAQKLVPEANYLCGMHQLEANRYASGLTHLKIAAVFEHKEAMEKLADLEYENLGKFENIDQEKARKSLEISWSIYIYLHEKNPEDNFVRERLGKLFYLKGEYRKALPHLKKGSSPESFYLCGVLYEQGLGVAVNLALAERYYILAMKGKYDKAKGAAAKVQGKIRAERIKKLYDHTDSLKPKQETVHVETKKSLCYITTATCIALGKEDNCPEIMQLKNYRDTWLIHAPDGKELISSYYELAPKIVTAINQRDQAKEIYRRVYQDYLEEIMSLLTEKRYEDVKNKYRTMVEDLQITMGV